MNSFADNLRILRTNSGKTQTEMSEIIGVNQSVYAQYETGAKSPNVHVAEKIADYFGVTLDELVKDGVCNDT